MSRKAEATKIYEAGVVTDALARLAKRLDVKALPFSHEELQTLAERARESFTAFRSEEKKQRLGEYRAHLTTVYGARCVEPVWEALEQINSEIRQEEK
jgi:hypothetical protein